MKCFREIAQRSCPREGVTLFYGLSYETVELNKKKKKGKKRVAKVVLFSSAMALCFARLSYSLFRRRTRGQRRGFI